MSSLLKDLQRRIMLAVARGVVRLVDDNGALQALQISLLKNETRNNIERFQNYGFSSVPRPGSEAVVVFVGGNRDHGLCIAVDDRRYRLNGLEGGEVAIYTDEGDSIVLRRGNRIEVTTETYVVNATTAIEMTAPTVTIAADTVINLNTPNVAATGHITDADGNMANIRTIYNSHTHPENSGSGPTDPPNQQMPT